MQQVTHSVSQWAIWRDPNDDHVERFLKPQRKKRSSPYGGDNNKSENSYKKRVQ